MWFMMNPRHASGQIPKFTLPLAISFLLMRTLLYMYEDLYKMLVVINIDYISHNICMIC